MLLYPDFGKKRKTVLGVPFDDIGFSQSLSLCVLAALSGRSYTVVTPNLEIALRSRSDTSLSKNINNADLVLCDGVGVLCLSRILSFFDLIRRRDPEARRLKYKVPGCDLAYSLLQFASKHPDCPLSFFLLGGAPGVAERAAKNIKASFPFVRIAGTSDGFSSLKNSPSMIARSGANIVFCCLGSPLQENYAAYLAASLPRPVTVICLGGTVDLLAGDVRRAPLVMRKLCLEWLYRFAARPERINRFLSALFSSF